MRLLLTVFATTVAACSLAQTTHTVYAFSSPVNAFSINEPPGPIVSDIIIELGDTVEWEVLNGTHDSVADLGQLEFWSSGLMGAGGTFQHTFTNLGVFTYYCTPHQFMGMTGTVQVVPEPTTIAVLALGGLGLLLRRRGK